MAKKAEYDEQALGPRRITEEDWYGLARRDRAAIVDQFGGPPVGECVGRVQDLLHSTRSWALLDRFMAAMQRALEADRVRDQVASSFTVAPRHSWSSNEDAFGPAPTAADDEPDLHQPQGELADPQAFKSDPAA